MLSLFMMKFILIVIIGFSYLDLGIDLEKIENVKIVPTAYSVHSAPISSKPNAADRETIYVHCRFEEGGYPDFYVESYSLYGHEGLSYIQEQIDEKNSIRVNKILKERNIDAEIINARFLSVLFGICKPFYLKMFLSSVKPYESIFSMHFGVLQSCCHFL